MRIRMKEEGQPKRRTWTETGSPTPVLLYLLFSVECRVISDFRPCANKSG